MPWRVGLDEAGYGPNLGPLVLASTACHVPDDAPPCLWTALESAVRKKSKKDDGRLLIDDSKKVNQAENGLARLEIGVHAALNSKRGTPNSVGSVAELLEHIALGHTCDDLAAEPWFGDHPLPVANNAETISTACDRLADAARNATLEWGPIHAVAIPTPRFNRLLDEWRVKSGVLATGVIALLQASLKLPGNDAIHIAVDKLGGRNYYAPLLNEAFSGCWIHMIRESAELCEYRIEGLDREVFIRFEPRADGSHLNVALASMTAKYLREVLMILFNRYWETRVPGIKPTAGYPVDAARFFAQIRNVLSADGTEERAVWRAK